ncbi:MAG: DNA-processing protein DprA [Desulfobacterium sp.]|nr:DNA-processing protein DprA [Desulfobacterium sp.]
MISTDKYLPWFIVKSIPGIGNHLYKRLIHRFKTPEKILKAGVEELTTIPGISQKAIQGITHCTVIAQARAELDAINRTNLGFATMNDVNYPPLLREIPDPPPFFTFQGTLDTDQPCISIVGSRNATSYGLESAYRLGYDLATRGFQVVSGMATGIDTAAHRGALAARGRTVAILGSGLNWVYPRRNLPLFNEICQTGAVISEFPPYTRPEPRNFPIRNRIIAGISTGTIVVEAAARSGSLITARLAADFSREVFAVPGSITSQKSHGTHALIRQGATLVENHGDIIQELHHMVHLEPAFPPSPSGDKIEQKLNKVEQAIVSVLEPYPQHIDKIVEQTDLDIGAVSAALLDLELNGMVKQLPGKLFSIKEE